MMEMGAPYSDMEVASFMSCSKGYMGECGIRGGYAEVVNMDPGVMAMLQKSIWAKLCPTVLGQVQISPVWYMLCHGHGHRPAWTWWLIPPGLESRATSHG